MDERLAEATARQRFQMQVLMSFAVVAVILAAVGLYGVLSHFVTSSRSTIGIRMALGARRSSILGLVLREALLVIVAGAAAGLAGALAATRLLASLLFGLTS